MAKLSNILLSLCVLAVLTGCAKTATAPSERHLMVDSVALGQHINDFVADLNQHITTGTWTCEKNGDKAYITYSDLADSISKTYMADLYNDTVYCFYIGGDYAYDRASIQEIIERCDTMLSNDPEYISVLTYGQGGYVNYIFEPDSYVIAYTDSIGYNRNKKIQDNNEKD